MKKRTLERRKNSPIQSIPYLFWGRRQIIRRDRDELYVDKFNSQEYLAIALLCFFIILDGLLTSLHLANGAAEANPFLNWFYLNHGINSLLFIKGSITIPALLIIILRLRYPLAQKGMWFLISFYGLLFCYHLWGFSLS